MAAGIETVRPFVINRTATTQAQALCVVTAYRALDLIFYRPTAGLLGYDIDHAARSEEHTSELQSLMRISYAVFCLKKNKNKNNTRHTYEDKYSTTNKTYDP